MLLTERELEEVCVAIMRHKDANGKHTMWASQTSQNIFEEFISTGRVVIDVIKDE